MHEMNFPTLFSWHILISEAKGPNYKFNSHIYFPQDFWNVNVIYIYHKSSFAVWLDYLLTILFLSANKLLTVVISTTLSSLNQKQDIKKKPTRK